MRTMLTKSWRLRSPPPMCEDTTWLWCVDDDGCGGEDCYYSDEVDDACCTRARRVCSLPSDVDCDDGDDEWTVV